MCERLHPAGHDPTRRRLLAGLGALLVGACAPIRRPGAARVACPPAPAPPAAAVPPPPRPPRFAVVTRAAWGAEPLKENHDPMDGVRRITVHHTAELPGMRQRSDLELVKAVQHLHRNERGWADIGYHWLIGRGGEVFEGRSVAIQGAHAGSGHNGHNLGVSLIGDFSEALPAGPALATLERFLEAKMHQYGVEVAQVFGHRDFKPTECPGSALYRWLETFKAARGAPRPADAV